MSRDYHGNLDQKIVKRAESELKENPKQIGAHIASLRRWLISQPHLTCRSDDAFLLRFLRVAKYDHSRAQLMLDNFCTIRKSPRGSIDWFERPSICLDDPMFHEYLKTYTHIPLGCLPNGDVVIMGSMKNWDINKFSFIDFIKMGYMTADLLTRDPRVQICGVKLFVDLENGTTNHFSKMENPRTLFEAFRSWQDAFPMRMKAIIYYNEPPMFDFIYTIIKNAPFIKPKFKSLLYRVGKRLDKLKDILGEGAEDVLPEEYGGKNGTLDSIRMKKVAEWHSPESMEEWNLLDQISVDEKKREKETQTYLMNYQEGSTGISGTFTKLNVD